MADNVAITAGSGTTIATDDISTVHYQRVKLVDGTLDSTTAIVGDARGLWVTLHRDVVRVAVASGGLTTAATGYTAGDQVGTEFTIANAASVSAGSGTILSVILQDTADIIGAYDVVFTRSSITPASDNAAYSISDADSQKIIGIVQLAGSYDIGGNHIAQAHGLSVPFDCAATSLFATLICRSAHTFFAATTDLQLTVFVERH